MHELTLPLMIAPVMAGAKNPVAEPRVLVRPLSVPAKFGAISCSDREEPLLIGPVAPTDRHITTMANTGSQFTHIIAINPSADTYKADSGKKLRCLQLYYIMYKISQFNNLANA